MAMKLGDPIDGQRLPWVRRLHHLDEAWGIGSSGARMAAVCAAGRGLGDELRSGPRVAALRTLAGAKAPYPTTFAFNHAVPALSPLVIMQNRALLVQVWADGALRNVLFNPTDAVAAAQTPFYRKLAAKMPAAFRDVFLLKEDLMVPQLRQLGIEPEDIDVVAYDHFHTQDLRGVLGANGGRGRFPNAVLLAPRREWVDWDNLHPMQRNWFIPEGRDGVAADRVVLFDSDVALGDGCLLLRTPGHTSGNQTLFVHTDSGVWGSSENGTSADSWSPESSRLPGLAKAARDLDVPVMLNCNTPEYCADQYISMMLEREVVDRVKARPEFFQMLPSSEVTPHWVNPFLWPSMIHGPLTSGTLTRPDRSRPRPATTEAHAAP